MATARELRQSAPLVALASGLAICLAQGEARGAVVFGDVLDSNAATLFGDGDKLVAFDARASLTFNYGASFLEIHGEDIAGVNNVSVFTNGAGNIAFRAEGVYIGASFPVADFGLVREAADDKYLTVRFTETVGGGTYRGWLHVVTNNVGLEPIKFDKWAYQTTAGSGLKTLAPSLRAQRLPLSNGRTLLQWSSDNEEGLASYRLEQQNLEGDWEAVATEAPGEAKYAATVPGKGVYRVVAEKVDGTSEIYAF